MICPRCRSENAPARLCAACGAPLTLGDDPAPRPLDVTLADARPGRLDGDVALDRRGPRAGAGGSRERAAPAPAPARAASAVPPPERAVTPTAPAFAPGSRTASPTPAPAGVPPRGDAAPPEGPAPGAASPLATASPPAPLAGAPAPSAAEAVLPTARPTVALRRPPSWRRAAAWAVDGLPFAAFGTWLAGALARPGPEAASSLEGLLDLLVRDGVIVLSVALFVAVAAGVYATLAHALAGATLGKRLLRLRVAGPGGARPTLGRSAVRSLAALLSFTALGLGFLAALFTRSGRALHDVLSGTWVVEAP